MSLYRQKPPIVEAWQFGDPTQPDWILSALDNFPNSNSLNITTQKGIQILILVSANKGTVGFLSNPAPLGTWVLLKNGGILDLMTDVAFQSQFEKV